MRSESADTAALYFLHTAQVLWSVQVVLCAAFVAAFWALSSRLSHPLMQALHRFWMIRLLISAVAGAFWWFDLRSAPTLYIVAAIFGATGVLGLLAARAVVDTTEATSAAPLTRRWIHSAVGGAVLYPALLLAIGQLVPDHLELMTVICSRLAFYLPYLALAYWLWREQPHSRRVRAHPLLLGTLGVLLLAIPDSALRVVAFATPLSAGQSAFAVGVAIVGTMLFGIGTLLGALESECDAIRINAERMRMASLRLVDSERLQGLGELAGGVAHDFNNVLGTIVGGVDLALFELRRSPDAAQQELQAVQSSALRGAALTRRLLQYARRRPVEAQPFFPESVLREFVPVLARLVQPKASLDLAVCATASVWGDASQFEQIVLNLVTNARDALSQSGRVALRLDQVEDVRHIVPTYGALNGGPYARLTVEDNGSGIADCDLPLVFNAFFTTKGLHGTGLGLSTVARILDELGGAAEITSVLQQGTRFVVYLPCMRSVSSPLVEGRSTEPHTGLAL
ncbi:sensor histidine kinase [Gemmatimonas sp.]